MRTLDELRKEINGKVAVDIILKMDVIFIWPPKGEQVSVKPYGYTPEEVLASIENAGFKGYTLEQVSAPEFCISSMKQENRNDRVFQRLADIPENGEFDFIALTEGHEEDSSGGGDIRGRKSNLFDSDPSCPYV